MRTDHTLPTMVLVKVAGIPKSSLWMRKLKPPEGRNLPRVLHTIKGIAGKGPRSPDFQCRDLTHLAHSFTNIY